MQATFKLAKEWYQILYFSVAQIVLVVFVLKKLFSMNWKFIKIEL